MEYLHLEVSDSVSGDKSKRVTHLREDGSSKKIDVFYEFDRIVQWSENTLLDGHVFAILLYALSRGKPLKVHGTISHMAMRNLEELQSAWCMWRPELYKKIEIIPDKIDYTSKIRKEEKAISLFSGGVDSIYTALRHKRLLAKNVHYPLTSVLMVHGFDVDMYNGDGFSKLTRRVRPIVDDLGLEFRTLRTNSRELKIQEWDYSHGLELAACLHICSDEFDFGLIGSSGPYDSFGIPWGSSPVTDHLISGNNFSIVYDGGGTFRTDKVKALINYPLACQALKVCYEAGDQSGNCGNCEKCIRTKLNFLAAGATSMPNCFPNGFDIQQIKNITINPSGQFREYRRIVKYARSNNIAGEWISIIERQIAEWEKTTPSMAANIIKKKNASFIKKFLAKLCVVLHIDEPAKKIWRKLRRTILK
jgi:hypothetical protein